MYKNGGKIFICVLCITFAEQLLKVTNKEISSKLKYVKKCLIFKYKLKSY